MGTPVHDSYKIRCQHCGAIAVGPMDRAAWAQWLKLSAMLMVADDIAPVAGLAVKGGD